MDIIGQGDLAHFGLTNPVWTNGRSDYAQFLSEFSIT